MNLSTIDRVKVRIGVAADDTQYDALLASMLARSSSEAERVMNRDAETVSRTAQYDVRPGTRSVCLPAYPITSITTIWNDRDRVFGTETAISSSDYYSDASSGMVHFEAALVSGYGALKITYTGGMGASVAAFIAAYPDIADAVDERVAQLWQRRDEIGLTGVSGNQGSVNRVKDDWPDAAYRVVQNHRRWGST